MRDNSTTFQQSLGNFSDHKTLQISQSIQYQNTSTKVLDTIYLNDWAHSFSSKTTPLGIRFSEDYRRRFHFAKDEERGYTTIQHISTPNNTSLTWRRLDEHPDIIEVVLNKPLDPKEAYNIKLNYSVRLPDEKFTRYGYYDNGDFKLRYWYITPTVYNGEWQIYSHKNLDDQFIIIFKNLF